MIALGVTAASAVLIALAIGAFNGLVRSRARVREAWSTIDVQLRRRANLIPNLVETVRGYAAHESGTFEAVTRARGGLEAAGAAADAARANQELGRALGRLLAVAESYPELRASENFRALQDELSDTEEKIAYARQFYNRNVLDYNTRIQVFPGLLIARGFAFQREEFFEADAESRATPQFDFAHPVEPSSPPAA